MTGAITWEQVAFFLGLLVTVVGFVSGVWWRVEGKINAAKDKADSVASALAEHKLHVAETYSTKSGMKEIRDEILGAVSGIRDDVRLLATRIDTMHEAASKPRPMRRPAD